MLRSHTMQCRNSCCGYFVEVNCVGARRQRVDAEKLESPVRLTLNDRSIAYIPAAAAAGNLIGCLHDRANVEQTSSWLKQAYWNPAPLAQM